MTTPLPELWVQLVEIRDRQALQVVAQLVQSEINTLQAQVTELAALNQALEERMKGMK